MNNEKVIKIINTIEKYLLLITVFLYPLIVLTNFSNVFETPKLILISVSLILILLTKCYKLLILKNVEYNRSSLDIFVVLISLAFGLSAIFSITNKIDAFLLPGSASFVIIGALFFFFINQRDKEFKEMTVNTLILSGSLFSVLHILSAVGITKLFPFLPSIFKLEVFNTIGNSTSALLFLIALLPFSIGRIIQTKDLANKVLLGLVSLIIVIGSSTLIYFTFIKQKDQFFVLKPKYGWQIAIDSIKVSPFFGVGPSNFSYAFNKFRPVEFNQETNWKAKYTQSTSYALNIITETGILGIISLIYLLYVIFTYRKFKNPAYISVLIYIVTLFVLPVSPTLIFIFMIIFALLSDTKQHKLAYLASKIPQLVVSIFVLLLVAAFTYVSARAFYGELIFSNSLKYISQNKAVEGYDAINKAVRINPYSDKYHALSSAIDLAIANNLAKNKDLKEEDKQKISQLIQQSIREGKATVSVAPYNSTNWESLADIYKTIIPFAKGSEDFAVQSLSQAIALDPINPDLRIKLGGILYSLKQYDKAIDVFKITILAKPNYANSYYNLGLAYKENKELDKAKEAINTTLKLLGKDSKDYETALKELQKIDELTKPEEKPEPVIDPQINLNDNGQGASEQNNNVNVAPPAPIINP